MSLGEILFLYRARLRERVLVVQELLAVLGIAVGVALLFASQVASTSLDSSVRQLTTQLFGATQYQLQARGPEGVSERVVAQAQSLAGVRAALALLQQQASVSGPSGSASVQLIGADPRLAAIGGAGLRRLATRELALPDAIALPAPIASSIGAGAGLVPAGALGRSGPGAVVVRANPTTTVELRVGTNVVRTILGTTLRESDVGTLAQSRVALAPLAYAQRLAGMSGRVSRVFVQVRPGAASTARAGLQRLAAAQHLNLEPADFDATLFALASAPAQQGEGLFSAISAIVGFLFAFNAMLLTVPERRRMIEAMRRRGTTRAMTVQALTFDALVIGVLACVLGLALGELLSVQVFHSQPGYLSFAFPVGSQRIVTWPTVALALGAGLLAAFVGVLAPLRDILARPLRFSAAPERAPRGWSVGRASAGVLCLAITTLIVLIRPQSAIAGIFTLILALLLLLPLLFDAIVAGFDRVQRSLHSSSTVLAVSELRDPPMRVRSLAIAATGAIAVFGSVAIAGAQHNLQSGLNRTAAEWNEVTGLWVSPSGEANTLGTTPFPFPGSLAARLRGLPAVAGVSVYRGSFLDLGDRRAWVIAPPRSSSQLIPSGQLTAGGVALANARLRGHGWAVLSEAIADALRLRIGESFMLPSPDPMRFRLAGLSTNAGWPPGAIVINAEDYARAWGSNAASALNVTLAPGFSPAQARRQVIAALPPRSGLAVQSAGERARQWQTVSRQGLSRLTQIATLVLIAAVLAMAGVMISMIYQRRERIAYIKRLGFTRGLLWRALLFESAVLLGAGCSIGAVFGLYGQLVISHALASVTGFPITISVGALIAISSFALVSATALAIVAIPGYLAVRVRPTMVKPA